MEFLNGMTGAKQPIKAVLFDFDGTISTLRCGWEEVMAPFMAEVLGWREDEVGAYINESAGVQTIFQMKWLAERVRETGREASDPWEYKEEYNRRLMRKVSEKLSSLTNGETEPEKYLMDGAKRFLEGLRERGVGVYVASGTDDPDVRREARALGVAGLFDELRGAPVRAESCSKEAVLRELIERHGLHGGEVAVIGDGKVEIALGKAIGAFAVGLASDEAARRGVNEVKRERLIKAGADVIAGDFGDFSGLMAALRLAP